LSGVVGDGHDHLLQADVAVAVAIERSKALFRFLLSVWAHDFNEIVLVQVFLAFGYHGHPNSAREGLGALVSLQGRQNNRVGRVGIENLLARDFRRDVTEDGGDLVPDATGVSSNLLDQAHRCATS